MDASAVLPPVGMITEGEHSLVTTHLTNLAREASEAATDWIAAAESNLNIYTYGADPKPDSGRVISNQVQDSVNAIVDFQTKDPPLRKLEPIERGEPGQVYYFTPDGQVQGPFTPEQAQQMQQQQIPTGAVDPQTGAPLGVPAFNPANFVTLDDKTTAEFFQKQLDVYWARGQLDRAVRSAVHYANVFGYLFPLYEWDQDYHRPRLWTDISLKNTYIDPTRANIEDAAYAGVDWWLDAEKAKTMFPHLADIIEERARTGVPDRPSSETQFGFAVEQVSGKSGFKRNTIILRVFWLRDQPCPYEENEAIAAGLLERVMVPVGDPGAIIVDETQQFPKGAADDTPGPQSLLHAGSEPTGEAAAVSGNAPDGGTVEPGEMAPPAPQQEALLHSASGAQVTPPQPGQPIDPNWPMYRCVRQITAVLNLVVDDREVEYFDIPMLQMVGTPIPYSPFGQGLPARLAPMQDARSQMLTGIRDHTEAQTHPIRVLPLSAWNRLPAKFKAEGASLAGQTIAPDDDTYKAAGGLQNIYSNPAPLAPALVEAQGIFHNELTERSGNPDILQGNPPPGVKGWQAIQLLSQNAGSRFGFSIQWTRDMVTRLCRFVLDDIINPKKVTPADLHRVDSRYPEALVALFQQRAAMMEWDWSIDIQTGVGSSKSRKQAEAMELHNTVDPVTRDPVMSTQTLRDVMGVDNTQEEQRNAQAREAAMQAAAQQQMQQQALAPPPGEGKGDGAGKNGSSNGNGRMSFGGGNGNGQH